MHLMLSGLSTGARSCASRIVGSAFVILGLVPTVAAFYLILNDLDFITDVIAARTFLGLSKN